MARLKLTGTVRYLPDEVQFRDCRSGLEWPVAIGGDYEPLERAYATSGLKAGDALLVSFDARIEPRSAADRERESEENEQKERGEASTSGRDGEHERDAEHEREERERGADAGAGRMSMVVIEKFRRAMPGESCPDRTALALLANTRWRPVRIADKTVTVASGQQEPWIVLDDRAGRVTGSGGCNRITGSYTAGDGTLRFGALASTRMACPAMELEQRFLAALEGTRRFRRSGRTLDLLDDRGKTLARLEERNL
jgi:heat shock protein HslJ